MRLQVDAQMVLRPASARGSRRIRLLRLSCLLWLLMATATAATAAPAAPSAELVRARSAFQRGDYSTAIPLLSYLLYPAPRLSDSAELAEAHLLLGVAYFETGAKPNAEAEFDKALVEDKDLTLDPLFVSKEAVRFFEQRKVEFIKRAAEGADKRRMAEELAAYRRALQNLIVIEKRPYYVNFIPFGAGQFQNGHNGKGIFFSVSQGLTGGASLLIFGFHAIKYGFGGKVPREDADGVRRLQQIQVGAGVATLALMAWGVIDSLINYEPSVRRAPDESLLPDRLRPRPSPTGGSVRRHKRTRLNTRASSQTSPRIYPVPLRGGGGLILSWGF